MQSNDLLYIRSGAAGLPGPYLQENLAPYEILDHIGDAKPRIILVMEGNAEGYGVFKEARKMPSKKFPVRLQRHGRNVLVRCKMHQQPDNDVPRILAGRVPGHYSYHLVERPPATMAELAYRVYCDVFALFSDIVLIFVEDFGGIERVLSFLCFWIQRRQSQRLKLRTHFVLATDKHCLRDIRFELLAAMVADQRKCGPSTQESVANLKKTISDFTELSVIGESPAGSDLVEKLYDRRNHREAQGLHFTASHTKVLLRAAIAHHANKPTETFNIVAASRSSYPVPADLGLHIGEFLAACPLQPADHYPIVASALVMNAFHPGLHSFPPNMAFNALYAKQLAACELRTGYKGLTDQIRTAFVDIAKHTTGPVIDARVQHLARMQGWRPTSRVKTRATCSICLIRAGFFALDCSHLLCAFCMAICYSHVQPCHYRPSLCLLCQQPNHTMFVINPPTAGYRKIKLGGLAPDQLLRFLQELQRAAGPTGVEISLQDYFDVVEATETGIFYILALFIEGWSFLDCKHHLPSITDFKATKTCVTFGGKISWNIPQDRQYNGSKVIFNSSGEILSNAQDPSKTFPAIRGLVLRYCGEAYTSGQLNHAANRLFSSMFYIELAHPPTFYTSPETCAVKILCRIQPGPILSRTLVWLRTNRIRIKYKGHESSSSEAVLCTDDVLLHCSEGRPFCRTVVVTAYSLETLIEIQLGPFDGRFYSVSGCPYELGHLVQHQEQGWPVNSQTHKQNGLRTRKHCSGLLQLELARLIEAVRLIL